MTAIEDKILRNFDYCLIKSVLMLNFYIFFPFEKLDKNFEKKVAKFLRNGFLFLSKQSRTQTERMSQKPEPNQNQMVS
jgi:hypothetical protein